MSTKLPALPAAPVDPEAAALIKKWMHNALDSMSLAEQAKTIISKVYLERPPDVEYWGPKLKEIVAEFDRALWAASHRPNRCASLRAGSSF
jgi:hypothetical protein